MTGIPRQPEPGGTDPALKGERLVSSAADAAGRLLTPGEVDSATQEGLEEGRTPVESPWTDIIEVAKEIPSNERGQSGGPIPPQRDTPKGRKSSARKAAQKSTSPLHDERRHALDEWVELLARQHDNRRLDETNANVLRADIGLCAEIINSVDRILSRIPERRDGMTQAEIDEELQFRQGCADIRGSVEALIPEETAQDKFLAAAARDVTRYDKLQATINEVRDRGGPRTEVERMTHRADLRALRGLVRVFASRFKGMGIVGRVASEVMVLKEILRRDNKNGNDRLSSVYLDMARGLKCEVGVLEACEAEFSDDSNKGWTVLEADDYQDVEQGMDLILTVPQGDGPAATIGLDVKAAGAFAAGVKRGKYIQIPGFEGSFAIKIVGGNPVLVVNAEDRSNGGGLARGQSVSVGRGDRRRTIDLEAWRLIDPHQFVESLKIAARVFVAQLPTHGGGGQT